MSPDEIKRIETQWKSDVDLKLDRLVSFADKYEKLLDLLLAREQARERLRTAIIEKTLSALIWASIVFVGVTVVSYAKAYFNVKG